MRVETRNSCSEKCHCGPYVRMRYLVVFIREYNEDMCSDLAINFFANQDINSSIAKSIKCTFREMYFEKKWDVALSMEKELVDNRLH